MRIYVLFIGLIFSINWDYDDNPKNNNEEDKGLAKNGNSNEDGNPNNNPTNDTTNNNPTNDTTNNNPTNDTTSNNPTNDTTSNNPTNDTNKTTKSKKVKIDTSEMKTYMEYCQSKYTFFKKRENYKLERLIVIFRHGDRAPIRNISDEWRNKNCVECPLNGNTIGSCTTKKCEKGDLTVKGSKQAKQLGSFIKQKYKPLLFEGDVIENDIGFRATQIKRTHSTLFNVMAGLSNANSVKGVEIRTNEDGLLRPKNCKFLESEVAKESDINESLQKKLDSSSLNTPRLVSDKADEIRCSMCNDISVSCVDKSCDMDTLKEIVKLSYGTWTKQMKNVSTCEKGKKIIFGRFANDLLDMLDSDKLLYLVSAHDGTLGMILSAISSETYPWPSYASALFIEVWCKYGRQFVRLIFNDRIVEYEEYSGEYIPISKFTGFLEQMKLAEGEMENLCGQNKPQGGDPNSSDVKKMNLSSTSLLQNKYLITLPLLF
ncbi:hypothetical protein NGRA_1379 [Nosema granulosis]|uniref:Acid phosphatase n=1 Tax=Nosema granulosis TaxID=83296 RepID=A0A9P6H1V5_9MICR|nr:hypothetical protein NGRA_1379 [Nosema granulosis]